MAGRHPEEVGKVLDRVIDLKNEFEYERLPKLIEAANGIGNIALGAIKKGNVTERERQWENALSDIDSMVLSIEALKRMLDAAKLFQENPTSGAVAAKYPTPVSGDSRFYGALLPEVSELLDVARAAAEKAPIDAAEIELLIADIKNMLSGRVGEFADTAPLKSVLNELGESLFDKTLAKTILDTMADAAALPESQLKIAEKLSGATNVDPEVMSKAKTIRDRLTMPRSEEELESVKLALTEAELTYDALLRARLIDFNYELPSLGYLQAQFAKLRPIWEGIKANDGEPVYSLVPIFSGVESSIKEIDTDTTVYINPDIAKALQEFDESNKRKLRQGFRWELVVYDEKLYAGISADKQDSHDPASVQDLNTLVESTQLVSSPSVPAITEALPLDLILRMRICDLATGEDLSGENVFAYTGDKAKAEGRVVLCGYSGEEKKIYAVYSSASKKRKTTGFMPGAFIDLHDQKVQKSKYDRQYLRAAGDGVWVDEADGYVTFVGATAQGRREGLKNPAPIWMVVGVSSDGKTITLQTQPTLSTRRRLRESKIERKEISYQNFREGNF